MQAIIGGLSHVQPAALPGLDVPGYPRSTRLVATALYDAWLLTWPDGSSSGPHDHGSVRSVLRVVEGELVEIITDLVDDAPSVVRLLQPGDMTWGRASLVHDLTNRSGAEVTTLHVFSPPLDDIGSYDRQIIDREPQQRPDAVDGNASLMGAAEQPCPPQLSLVQP
jgi:predicted metal-dependent enzyme (double-stranded beta helix superfamily)